MQDLITTGVLYLIGVAVYLLSEFVLYLFDKNS